MISLESERVNGVYSLDLRLQNWTDATASMEGYRNFVRRCKEDPVFYANNCFDTYNPQMQRSKNRPFLLCLRQEECLVHIHRCVTSELDSVYPKTRKVGESWLHMGYCQWQWQFTEGFAAIVGSRTNELVESKGAGDMDALFPKFDFMERHLPPFMRIKEYGAKNPYKVDFLRANPLNGAQIKGEAVTPDFGSGPRASYALIDELSKCKWGRSGWSSCGQTAPSRHGVFTPKGKEFAWSLTFPERAEAELGKRRLPRPEVFRIYYKDIPWFNRFVILSVEAERERQWSDLNGFNAFMEENRDKVLYEGNGYCPDDIIPMGMGYDAGGEITNYRLRKPLDDMPSNGVSVVYPWREREGFRYDDVEAAQELEIGFDTSKRGLVYAIQFERSQKVNKIERIPEYPLYCGYDPGRSAGNAMFLFWGQWNWEKRMHEMLREITAEGRSAYWLIPLLTGSDELFHFAENERVTGEYRALFQEMQHPMWRPNKVFVDPSAMAKSSGSKESVRSIFVQYGIPIKYDHAWRDFDTRIPAARKLLRYTIFDPLNVPRLMTGISQIAYPDESETSTAVTEKNGYVHHPIYSHPASAYEYYALGNPHRFDTLDAMPESVQQRVITSEQFNAMKKPEYGYDKMGKTERWESGVKGSGW